MGTKKLKLGEQNIEIKIDDKPLETPTEKKARRSETPKIKGEKTPLQREIDRCASEYAKNKKHREEIVEAQTIKVKSDQVLIVIGSYRVVPGKRSRIDLAAECECTRVNIQKLGRAQDHFIELIEPDRGSPRKALENIRGKITGWQSVPGKRKHLGVKIEFPNITCIREGLAQIQECDPPTAYLTQTQAELPATDPDDAN